MISGGYHFLFGWLARTRLFIINAIQVSTNASGSPGRSIIYPAYSPLSAPPS